MFTVTYIEGLGSSDVVHDSGCLDILTEVSQGATILGDFDDLDEIRIHLYGEICADSFDPETQESDWLEAVWAEANGSLTIKPCVK